MSSSLEDFNRQISNLIAEAKSTLKINRNDVEGFLSEVAVYLDKFEFLKDELEATLSQAGTSSGLKEKLAANLKDLLQLHSEIVERAEASKDLVADVISDVHKRSHALKKYVDGFPDRISMTKKKEG